MNEELKTQLAAATADTLAQVQAWADAGADFASREAPLLATEIITWGIVSNSARAAIYAALTLALWALATYVFKLARIEHLCKKDRRDYDDGYLFGYTITGIIVLVSVLPLSSTADRVLDALRAYFAPRLYLLQELGRLVG